MAASEPFRVVYGFDSFEGCWPDVLEKVGI
jgi:hypothetical protein